MNLVYRNNQIVMIMMKKEHWEKEEWPTRVEFDVSDENIQNEPVRESKKIILPPLHIKLGLMKQYVKALDKDDACFNRHVARMGESRNRVLVGRPKGKRPLGRLRRRWEDNIKMDLRQVGCDDRDWIKLAQDRGRWWAYVRAAMNLRFPSKPFDRAESLSHADDDDDDDDDDGGGGGGYYYYYYYYYYY
ncbi:hypothetical protein ANN_06365 [Periplaneta americana]|uniref:Uncharacterized protein n=1 Tax=Periplaneta americana TaxID=6978 RepID=A0ABQ8TFV3_PERAM|nr:hypothetical protein ANN_06365 [Periplaneta americana]